MQLRSPSLYAGLTLFILLSGMPAPRAQTLQLPAHRPAEVTPHVDAAPLTPVHQAAPQHAAPHHEPARLRHVPTLRPTGRTHAEKPPAHPSAAAPKPAEPPHPAPAVAVPAKPAEPSEPDKGSSTGLPLPRFVSLRTDDVNLRKGPGTRYPIEWVYKRRDLPVEIEREFDVWRLIRDADGIRGWVHQATLTGRRSFEVERHDATLRADPRDTAAPVAVLQPGVIGRIRSCKAGSAWCRVQVGQYGGWLRRDAFWGTLPGEAIGP